MFCLVSKQDIDPQYQHLKQLNLHVHILFKTIHTTDHRNACIHFTFSSTKLKWTKQKQNLQKEIAASWTWKSEPCYSFNCSLLLERTCTYGIWWCWHHFRMYLQYNRSQVQEELEYFLLFPSASWGNCTEEIHKPECCFSAIHISVLNHRQ